MDIMYTADDEKKLHAFLSVYPVPSARRII